jgi:hypothetical protein
MTVLQLLYSLRIKGCTLLLEEHHHTLSYNSVTFTILLFFTHTYTHTMICSAPFAVVFLFAQVALALPQAGSASTAPPTTAPPTTTPPTTTPPTSFSSTGTNNYSSTPASYTTTGSTSQNNSSSYASSSPSASSGGCLCNAIPSAWTGKNGTSYSLSAYTASSSCSCYSSTPYSSTPYSSQPTYTSSSASYYPPKGTGKPYPPPSNPSNCPEPPTSATLRTTYDPTYDNKSGSMNSVACSNGANGLLARFPTFGDVPSFPFIGGAFDVVWNSPNCGSCWNLTNVVTGNSINIVAVDAAGPGFNIAQEAFVQLNGGQIGKGVLDVSASKVAPSVCGL